MVLTIWEKELSIYPNPTFGVFFVNGKEINSVSISDLSGRTILKTTSSELDLSQLVNGTYLIFIEHTNGTGELIKVRLSR
ncbi:MAG: T9SS type A sorting domain-containing protein [Cyclobacteriaceae bacterium]